MWPDNSGYSGWFNPQYLTPYGAPAGQQQPVQSQGSWWDWWTTPQQQSPQQRGGASLTSSALIEEPFPLDDIEPETLNLWDSVSKNTDTDPLLDFHPTAFPIF